MLGNEENMFMLLVHAMIGNEDMFMLGNNRYACAS